MNKSLKKDVSKVVNKVDIEDIAAKKKENVAFCRCYKSKAVRGAPLRLPPRARRSCHCAPAAVPLLRRLPRCPQ